MAKKIGSRNIIEQHVEKAVLGVAALVALFSLAHWVFSSPRKVELRDLSNRTLTLAPDKVDAILAEMSQKLQEDAEKAEAKPPVAPDYLKDILVAVNRPGNDQELPPYVALGPGRPPLNADGAASGDRKRVGLEDIVAALPAPETPLVEINREVLIGANPAGADPKNPESQLKEVVVAHVAAVFEHGDAMKKWKDMTDKTLVRPQLVVVAVEAQRRQRQSDGSWGEPVSVSMAHHSGSSPVPALPSFMGENTEDIKRVVTDISNPAVEKDVLEPDYYDIIWPDRTAGTWMIKGHKPRTRVSDLLGTASSQPGVGQPLRMVLTMDSGAAPSDGSGTGAPARVFRDPAAGRTAPRDPAGGGRVMRDPGGGAGGGGRVMRDPGGGGVGRRAPVVRPVTPATPGTPTPKPAAKPEDTGEAELVFVPEMTDQINGQSGLLEAWLHDEQLQDGLTYSYRVRLVLANPLFGFAKDVAKDTDAKATTVSTPWSAWSEPASAPRATEFFFVGSMGDKQEAYVMVFAQKWGHRVKRQFTVKPGEMIGQEVEMTLERLDGQKEKTKVDFRTGVLFLDAEWDKQVRSPGGMVSKSVEALYQDVDGTLGNRVEARDKVNGRFMKLTKECQAPVPTPGPTAMGG